MKLLTKPYQKKHSNKLPLSSHLNEKIRMLLLLFIFGFSQHLLAQESLMGFFLTKDQDNHVKILKDRLNSDANYFFLFVDIDQYSSIHILNQVISQKEYWKTKYNLEIILIDDNHYNEEEVFNNKLDSLNIDVEVLRSEQNFKKIKVYQTPTKFLLPAHSTEPIRFHSISCGRYEKYFNSIFLFDSFEAVAKDNFEQYIMTSTCEDDHIVHYKSTKLDSIKNRLKFFNINNLEFIEDSITKTISLKKDTYFSRYINYSSGMCSKLSLVDYEGDLISIRIMDIIKTEQTIRLITDKFLPSYCGEKPVPFELIQGIGTNAGMLFDIEEGEIVSRLICHRQGDSLIYQDPLLEHLCLPSSTPSLRTDSKLSVFPNPSMDYVNINFATKEKRFLQLYDIRGNLLLRSNLNKKHNKISLNKLSVSGVYLIRISQKDGTSIHKRISIIKN